MECVHKIVAIYAVSVGGDTKKGNRLFAHTASNADPCINWLEFAQHSKVGYINESTATYRVLEESASNSKDAQKLYNFSLSACRMKQYLLAKYHCSEQMQKLIWQRMNRIKLSHSFKLQRKQVATQAFAHLSSNGMISLQDRLYYYGARNSTIRKAVSAFIKIIKILRGY